MATIQIHGKEYVPVADRVREMHGGKFEKISIQTEVLQHEPTVVIKATVTLDDNVYTGISAANPSKQIEKMSPYEVSETSAVGRALGFAGFGAVDSIASADEMIKASYAEKVFNEPDPFDENPFEGLVEHTVSDGEKCTKVNDHGSVCGGPVQIKVSGATAKNPNKKYWSCSIHKFSHWVS